MRNLRTSARVPICIALVLVAVIFSALYRYSPTSAAPGIILSDSVQITFPTSMIFKVTAQSDTDITSLRLHYKVNKQNFADVISEGWAQFNPAPSVDTQWLWDMRKSSLPVGSNVQYWWTAEDAGGRSSETQHSTVSFDDDRYKWQSITTDPITLLWYNGDRDFADALMNAGQQGLQRIERDTGAIPQGQVRIFIYASARDLQGAQLFAQQWEGGVTFEGYDIIAIGVAPTNLAYGEGAVPHELTHWIVGQITFNNYGAGLPTWLDEGLATYGEGTSSPNYPVYQSALNNAIKNNRLLSVRNISSPFSAIADVAITSYGESNSIVTFLIKEYGKDKMVQLLDVFHEGSTYDDALKQVYGFDQDGLDTLWKQSLGIKTSFQTPTEHMLVESLP